MAITVGAVADLLSQQFGPGWHADEALNIGNTDATVTGIAVTWTPTLEVLQRAVAMRQNVILSLEPPFWNGKAPEGRSPGQAELEPDPTYQIKSAFLKNNDLSVLNVRDGWAARNEDGQLRGLARTLQWENYHRPRPGMPDWASDNNHFVLPETTFGNLAQQMKKQLNASAIRCVGDPNINVARIALTHGYFLVFDLEHVLEDQQVDVVVCGEACEWEAVPYFMDLIASGQKKGMILLGSQVSSEPGCGEMANWLRGFIREIPIEWQPAGEPFKAVT